VVKRRGQRGFTMMEVVVTMALFGIFLFIIVSLTAEMRRNEKKWPIDFFSHPEVGGVLARIRRDVFDSTLILDNFGTYSRDPSTLIVYTINQDGTGETVVWDFSKIGEAHRRAFKATQLSSEWIARALPAFIYEHETMPSGADAVRIKAFDKGGKLAIDELFVPRPHA
jgi:prepilin-type N-terminal cleavage/methylation domain-containing protein